MKRRIGVVTVGRSDYGILYPLLRIIQNDSDCELCLIVGGAHLSPFHGNTITEIERDGFPISARVPMLVSGDAADSTAASIGLGVLNFANALQAVRPDILILLGDRFEVLAAAVSALPLRIPVGHIHGGELTQGAIDDSIRHAISKLSHLHFAATPTYGRRIEQMGEASETVFVTGSPVIDTILSEDPMTVNQLEAELGAPVLNSILITYHPVTHEPESTRNRVAMLLDVLEQFDNDLIFTYPNADANNGIIVEQLKGFAARNPRAHVFVNLGHRRYHSLQRYIAAMVGNSSSGIIEAASFKLPVVNIGDRQKGRLRTPNIVDVPESSELIVAAIRQALSVDFRNSIARMESPYGKGGASQRILQILKSVNLDKNLLKKSFIDWPYPESQCGDGGWPTGETRPKTAKPA